MPSRGRGTSRWLPEGDFLPEKSTGDHCHPRGRRLCSSSLYGTGPGEGSEAPLVRLRWAGPEGAGPDPEPRPGADAAPPLTPVWCAQARRRSWNRGPRGGSTPRPCCWPPATCRPASCRLRGSAWACWPRRRARSRSSAIAACCTTASKCSCAWAAGPPSPPARSRSAAPAGPVCRAGASTAEGSAGDPKCPRSTHVLHCFLGGWEALRGFCCLLTWEAGGGATRPSPPLPAPTAPQLRPNPTSERRPAWC